MKGDMKREDLARQLAERRHISRAEACDELDQVVHQILKALRHGESADVPGVGRLTATKDGVVAPVKPPKV
jgi:nucleoid DNA-binding protein